MYRARRDGHDYAVKVPRSDLTQEQRDRVFRLFQREAVALARVRHPALPRMKEIGQSLGIPYLIMELVGRATLADYLATQSLPEQSAIELALLLAEALVCIQDCGLLHRDISPRNVIFDPGTGRSQLVDFGYVADLIRAPQADEPASSGRGSGTTEVYTAHSSVDFLGLGRLLYECGNPTSHNDSAHYSTERDSGRVSSAELSQLPYSANFVHIIARLAGLAAPQYTSFRQLVADLKALKSRPATRSAATGATSAKLSQVERPNVAKAEALGREAELHQLFQSWELVNQRYGQVHVMLGAAGSGKSTVGDAFVATLREEGARVWTASCSAWDIRPFSVVRQLIENFLGEKPSSPTLDRKGELKNIAADLSPYLTQLSDDLARLFHNAPPIPPSDDPGHVFAESLSEFLVRLVRSVSPLVVFVEDVHWLDSASRSVLKTAADRASEANVLYLFSARDDAQSVPLVRRLTAHLRAEPRLLNIGPLSEAQAAILMREYLGQDGIAQEDVERLVRLSDRTPMSVLEIVRTALDHGALVPHWGTWRLEAADLERMRLPRTTSEILAQRMRGLDRVTEIALTAAAVLGSSFDLALLRETAKLTESQLSHALAEAQRCHLVQVWSATEYRFVHHSVCEVLLAAADREVLLEFHQNAATAIEEQLKGVQLERLLSPDSSGERISLSATVYALATHYACGELSKVPRRVFEINALAGRLAFDIFDNARAIEFFKNAVVAAGLAGIEIEPELHYYVGEAHFRVGSLAVSLAEFTTGAAASSDGVLQALMYSRIAWIHEMQCDSEGAWRALEDAYAAIGEKLPVDSSLSLLGALGRWLVRSKKAVVGLSTADRFRIETLASIYYQTTRLGVQSGKPLRLIQSTLNGLGTAERLGPSAALAKAYLMYSFLLTVLGQRQRGHAYLERAQAISVEIKDPVAYAHCLQVHEAVAAWGGNVQEALEVGGRCANEHAHWQELTEYCLLCASQALMETLRGRSRASWGWLERALHKISVHEGTPVVHEFYTLGAQAALCTLGQDYENNITLKRMHEITIPVPRDSGFYAWTFGPRVRMFAEQGIISAELEEIVAAFKAENYDPRRVHLVVVEYYIAMAHARVHAVLRSETRDDPTLLAKLEDAARELRLASRAPLILAHSLAVDAYLNWFKGKSKAAERLFGKAETLAQAESCPWVLYAVARGRAHMLKAQGLIEAANDQARIAEALARAHGSVHRARWIREELGLARGVRASGDPQSSESQRVSSADVAQTQRHLRALLQVSRATARELDPEFQARAVLDELITALSAERGFLFWNSAALAKHKGASDSLHAGLMLIAGRDALGHDLKDSDDYDFLLIEESLSTKTAKIRERSSGGQAEIKTGILARSIIAAPLILHDEAVGMAYLEGSSTRSPFTPEDGEILCALANQVPVALELAKVLRDREQLSDDLRQAQKMEAVGRLAGGIAHDFNNMLAAIRISADALSTEVEISTMAAEDVSTIQSAADRASKLTRQLLAFSRRQVLEPRVVSLTEVASEIVPMLRRLLGERVEIVTKLSPDVYPVKVDPAQVEQVIMNLAVNARDAMPQGGTLTLSTNNIVLGADWAKTRPNVGGGAYATLSVTDTGEGMDEKTQERIFEPFFTTKGEDGGTGLGLATVYGIVQQSGGHIEVESEVGHGTRFAVYFPRTSEQRVSLNRMSTTPDSLRGSETILLVEDEPLVRQALSRMLRRLGYHAVVAKNGPEALRLAEQCAIDLVITDVIMPVLDGTQLVERLRRRMPGLRVLFISGYTDGALGSDLHADARVDFLQKPIAHDVFATRIRALLDREIPQSALPAQLRPN